MLRALVIARVAVVLLGLVAIAATHSDSSKCHSAPVCWDQLDIFNVSGGSSR